MAVVVDAKQGPGAVDLPPGFELAPADAGRRRAVREESQSRLLRRSRYP